MSYILSDDEYQDFVQIRRWYKNFRGPGIINRPGIGPTIVPSGKPTTRASSPSRRGDSGACGSQRQAKYAVVSNVMGCDWARFH